MERRRGHRSRRPRSTVEIPWCIGTDDRRGRSVGSALPWPRTPPSTTLRPTCARTPKGRAARSPARLADHVPGRPVRARPPQPVRAAGGHDPVGPDDRRRVNIVTPTLFARYPTAADLRRRRPALPSRRSSSRPASTPTRRRASSGWPTPSSSASTARCRPGWRTSSPSPGSRPQDRATSCAAWRSAARPAGRHARRAARRGGSVLTTEEDPVKVELELNRLPAGGPARRLQPAHDPPRPARRASPSGRRVNACSLEDICPSSRLPTAASPPLARAHEPDGGGKQASRGGCGLACLSAGSDMLVRHQPGSRHLVCSDSRDPPPGVARATAPPTRAVAVFRLMSRSPTAGVRDRRRGRCRAPADAASAQPGQLDGRCELALGAAQRSLGLVDRASRGPRARCRGAVRRGRPTRRW